MADSEKRLWYVLRGRRFLGYKFRRQVPIGSYIGDFVCISNRLIIEVDGFTHGNDEQEARDAAARDGSRTTAGESSGSGRASCRAWMRWASLFSRNWRVPSP